MGQAGQAERHDTKHDLPHEGPIKTPKQLIVTVLLAFVIPVVAIILLVNYVAHDHRPGAGSDGMTPEAIARRIQPVGKVDIRDASQPAALRTGEQVYTAQCTACHAIGAAGAPKAGDTAAWAPRLKQGFDALVQAALKGKGNMPAQAGGDFSDVEVARAVAHLGNQSGAKFTEPAAAEPRLPQRLPAPRAAPRPRMPLRPRRRPRRRKPWRRRSPPRQSRARPRRPRQCPPCTRRPARCATPRAWPARRSSATRPPGHRAWRKASKRSPRA